MLKLKILHSELNCVTLSIRDSLSDHILKNLVSEHYFIWIVSEYGDNNNPFKVVFHSFRIIILISGITYSFLMVRLTNVSVRQTKVHLNSEIEYKGGLIINT